MSSFADQDRGRAFAPPTAKMLARCDDEPIHLPGTVQPHGCLFEVEEDNLVVSCASSNLHAVLGCGTSEALGKPLSAVLGEAAANWATQQLAQIEPAKPQAVRLEARGRIGTLIVHRYMQRYIVEWLADEEHLFPAPAKMDQQLAETLLSAREAADLTALLQTIAEGVKAASGYDRVMVYRFHPDWHGEIIAEKTEPGLPAYRGLHYPASDIPAQARRLYIETRVRVIADVYARDAPLMDAAGKDSAERIDLSHALLRSVSPVHIQYLRNMGSGATLVTTLLVEGKLWGLIACHHRQRYPVPWYAFARMRCFTDDASALVEQRVVLERARRERSQAAGRERLVAIMDTAPADGLRQMMELVSAEGALACAGDHFWSAGRVPACARELSRLILAQSEYRGVTDSLRERFPSAAFDESCAGLAWRVLSRSQHAVVLFVRPEFERTVTWGGNPDKAVVPDPVTRRLNPRGSFDLWKQTVSGRSRPWEADTASLLDYFQERLETAAWVQLIEIQGKAL